MTRAAAWDSAIVEKLISAAGAAPSIHNTQPWHFGLDPEAGAILVRAVARRQLRRIDPSGRALHISIGAALFNLRVAAGHFGRRLAVRLLPEPREPGLLAEVRLTGAEEERPEEDLYDMVWVRRSSRFPFTNLPLPPEVTEDLVRAARAEDAELYLPGPEETLRVLRLTADGEQRTARDPDRRAESRAWIKDTGPHGLAPGALGPGDEARHVPVRDFAGLHPALPTEVFETNPTVAVLATVHDRRADWLRAGQALEHTLLVAAAHDVRASLLHQAIEWPDLRSALPAGQQEARHVQMLIRLGYGPVGRPSPRRAVQDISGREPRAPW